MRTRPWLALRLDRELLRARRRGPATTRGALFHLVAGYPALDPTGVGTVFGEWVDPVSDAQLSVLDLYEGVPEGLFQRVLVEVHAEGLMFEAWAWVMRDAAGRGGVPVPSGRWRSVSRR